MTFTNKQLAGLVVVGVLGAWYLSRKAKETAAAVGNAVNPVNPGNIFYSGVNEIGGAITGDGSFSLGSWFYDLTHKNEGF